MTDEQRSQLTKLAAEMVRGQDMPREAASDWKLPKATSRTVRREIEIAASIARAQCREWAKRLMNIVDADGKG